MKIVCTIMLSLFLLDKLKLTSNILKSYFLVSHIIRILFYLLKTKKRGLRCLYQLIINNSAKLTEMC